MRDNDIWLFVYLKEFLIIIFVIVVCVVATIAIVDDGKCVKYQEESL